VSADYVASVDGVVSEDARVSVMDRGFLYGDSVFEVFRTYGPTPHALVAHLDRMERSAEAIALTLPPRAKLVDDIRVTLEAAPGDRRVRVVITRGVDESGIAPSELAPTRVVIAQSLKPLEPTYYTEGIGVVTHVGVASPMPGAKVSNYLPSVMATGTARAAGAHEAVLVDEEGRVHEGATSNVFVVRDGVLSTPPLGRILAGVTRSTVLDLAKREDMKVREAHVALEGADEVFITSTVRELMPVVRVDGRTVADGEPGPVWAKLRARFRETLEERLGWP